MDINQIKETRASRAFRLFFEERGRERGLAEGKAEGLAEGLLEGRRGVLLAVLAARGLAPTPSESEELAALTDPVVLDRCLQAAVTCKSVAAILPGRGARPRSSKGTKKINGHPR